MLFTFGCDSSISQYSTTWILWTSAGCSERDSGQQLHVQLFGSTALLKQPLLFASAFKVLGMEKSIVLFPCHQQVQFIYVQSWQNLHICFLESPVLKKTEMNMKCTYNLSLFILVGVFVALLIEKMDGLMIPEVFVLQTALWDVSYCLGISKGRIWPWVWSYEEHKRKSHNAVKLQVPN